jgi:flagellar biosynthesis protein FlhF
MKVKRYFATSMRRALELARQQQGSEVMILSNRQVDGGVELMTASADASAPDTEDLAADTYAPSADRKPGTAPGFDSAGRSQNPGLSPVSAQLWTDPGIADRMQRELRTLRALVERQLSGIAWRDFDYEHPIQAALVRALSGIGLAPRFARSVASDISDDLDFEAAWRRCLGVLAHQLNVAQSGFLDHGGSVAFVGPPGAGKSTVLAKCAAQFALKHGETSVAIVTTDDVRLAAHQQLRSFGRILGIAVRTAFGADAILECLARLTRYRLVLIDTPGLPPQDPRMQALLGALKAKPLSVQTQLVLSATTDYRTLLREVGAYRAAQPAGWILTKLDLAAQLGGAITVLAEQRLPLTYVCAGQRIPDDLEPARAHRIVARAVHMGKRSTEAVDSLEFEQAFA